MVVQADTARRMAEAHGGAPDDWVPSITLGVDPATGDMTLDVDVEGFVDAQIDRVARALFSEAAYAATVASGRRDHEED